MLPISKRSKKLKPIYRDKYILQELKAGRKYKEICEHFEEQCQVEQVLKVLVMTKEGIMEDEKVYYVENLEIKTAEIIKVGRKYYYLKSNLESWEHNKVLIKGNMSIIPFHDCGRIQFYLKIEEAKKEVAEQKIKKRMMDKIHTLWNVFNSLETFSKDEEKIFIKKIEEITKQMLLKRRI